MQVAPTVVRTEPEPPAPARSALQELGDLVAALHARERQQATVARLGHQALSGLDLQDLFDVAVREVADTLAVRHVGLCQLRGDRFSFDAGLGWRTGIVGSIGGPPDAGSMAAFMLRTAEPLVYHTAQETRFKPVSILAEHGIASGMIVIVPGRNGPWGILGAHSTTERDFTPDDIHFLDAIAHVLGSAVERKQAEAELTRGRELLEQMVAERTRQLAASNRELEAFSYSVSHDLRAPLRTISGYTSLIEEHHREELSGETLHLVEGVRKSADRLGRLIDDLLDLSRVQRVDLVRREVDLSTLTAQVVADLRAAEPERQVAIDVEPGLRADGDARLLSTLMQNLISNAWKFTRHTAQPRIAIGHEAAGAAGGGTVFVVRDNGAGFDMAFAPKLFHPFQRLHRASEFEGTGVGLATVARIVERHGGRVWAEGRVGAGAAVYFTLGSSPGPQDHPRPL